MAKWINGNYNVMRRSIVGKFDLSVHYDSSRTVGSTEPPYITTIFGMHMKQRFDNQKDAIAYADKIADKWLRDAVAELDKD